MIAQFAKIFKADMGGILPDCIQQIFDSLFVHTNNSINIDTIFKIKNSSGISLLFKIKQIGEFP